MGPHETEPVVVAIAVVVLRVTILTSPPSQSFA
jgi:hypothetical protein